MDSPIIHAAERALRENDADAARELLRDPNHIRLEIETELSYIEAGMADPASLEKLNRFRDSLIQDLEAVAAGQGRPELTEIDESAPVSAAATEPELSL